MKIHSRAGARPGTSPAKEIKNEANVVTGQAASTLSVMESAVWSNSVVLGAATISGVGSKILAKSSHLTVIPVQEAPTSVTN